MAGKYKDNVLSRYRPWPIHSILVVETVVVARVTEALGTGIRPPDATFRKAEESAAAGILHALCKGLVASNLNVADGTACCLHGFLEVRTCKLRNGVFQVFVLVHHVFAGSLLLLAP